MQEVRAIDITPVRRRRQGYCAVLAHHVITEAHGIPLAVSLTGGNRNDVTQLMPLIEAIPAGPRPPRPPAAAPGCGLCRPWL